MDTQAPIPVQSLSKVTLGKLLSLLLSVSFVQWGESWYLPGKIAVGIKCGNPRTAPGNMGPLLILSRRHPV